MKGTHTRADPSDDARERLVGSLLEKHLQQAETDAAAKSVTEVLSRFLAVSRSARQEVVDLPFERAKGQSDASFAAAVRKEESAKLERLRAVDGQLSAMSRDMFQAKDAIYARTPVNLPLLEALDLLEDSIRYLQSTLSAKLFRGAPPTRAAGLDSGASKASHSIIGLGDAAFDTRFKVIVALAVASAVGFWFLVGPFALSCLLAPLIVWLVRNGRAGNLAPFRDVKKHVFCVSCKTPLPIDTKVGDLCPGCGKVIGDDMSM